MDKKVIFAVAGSGKTTYIVDSLTENKRYLIVTYTNANYENLSKKISEKFGGSWPENVTLMTYFRFLYRFCYKPFLADEVEAKGIIYEKNLNRSALQKNLNYYLSSDKYFYSNRLALFLEKQGLIDEIRNRIENYYDEFVIDEVQDIAGRDFNFLELLMGTNVNMLFVGDFYQHTYNTSMDGKTNCSLFENRTTYENRFSNKGVKPDSTTLVKSWRCGKKICDFISTNLGIQISSNRDNDESDIRFISDVTEKTSILGNPNIVKLYFENCCKHASWRRNWGDTKGEDCYQDVCVVLNKETMKKYKSEKLSELAPYTRNKLYVAITRAHGNVYLIEE